MKFQVAIAFFLIFIAVQKRGECQNRDSVITKVYDLQPESFGLKGGEETVYTFTEKSPEFPGGTGALFQFIKANTKYPQTAQKEKASGTILLKFIVEKNGRISGERILYGDRADFKREALKLVTLMPLWQPGSQNGKPLRTFMTVPVKFCYGGCKD